MASPPPKRNNKASCQYAYAQGSQEACPQAYTNATTNGSCAALLTFDPEQSSTAVPVACETPGLLCSNQVRALLPDWWWFGLVCFVWFGLVWLIGLVVGWGWGWVGVGGWAAACPPACLPAWLWTGLAGRPVGWVGPVVSE